MTRLALPIAVLTLGLGVAGAAQAQSAASGIINVNGTVAGRCSVNGVGAGGLNGTINLGELAGTDGLLLPSLGGAVVPGAIQQFRVTCNTGRPVVEIEATRLANAAPTTAGYANAVDYTATADVTTTSGSEAVDYTTKVTPDAPTRTTLGGPLSTAAGNNVSVRVHTMTTTAGELLTAGNYAGTITITISPS